MEYLSSIPKHLEVKKIAELTLSMQIGSDAMSQMWLENAWIDVWSQGMLDNGNVKINYAQ